MHNPNVGDYLPSPCSCVYLLDKIDFFTFESKENESAGRAWNYT